MRKNIIKVAVIGLILAFICSSTLMMPTHGFPDDQPAVVIEPSSIVDSAKTPGSTFTINISLYNVTMTNVPAGLAGAEVKLRWNNAILNLTSRSSKLGLSGGVLNPSVLTTKDEVGADYYWLAGASVGAPWFGNGVIATVTFTVLAVGRSNLELFFSDLVDANIISLPHYVQNGLFDNRGTILPAKIFVTPPTVINSSLIPPESFAINVSIADASDLSYLDLSMSFNASILEAADATWSWSGTPLTIDNALGTIQGSSSVSPPLNGNSTLVNVVFNVKALGQSDLHLYGITLFDSYNESLTFTTADGYFNNMLITRVFVDPPYRMDPTLRPGNLTAFDIRGENFIDIKTFDFTFLYNPNVVKIIGYITPPIDDGFVNGNMIIDNVAGALYANITWDPSVNNPYPWIMNIVFQVCGYGTSQLDLNTTDLRDSLGNPVTHQAEDGLLITVIRDVAIIDIQPSPQKVYPGRPVTVQVVAANIGNLSETFDVSAYVDNTTIIGTSTITDLAPGANITLTFIWDTAGQPSCHSHTLSANASYVPFEYNTTNNFLIGLTQVKIKILGDINGDGSVDLADLVLLANSYNSVLGDPRYNPEADIDNNGKVSLTDLVTVARFYNTSC